MGCFVASFACFSKAIYLFYTMGSNNFFYTDFSLFLHPSYFALYLNLAIIALFFWNFNSETTGFLKINKVLNYFLILIFAVTIILLSSKMGVLSLLVSYVLSYAYLFFYKKKFVKTLAHFFVFSVIMYFSYLYIIKKTRFSSLHNITESVQFKKINSSETDSLARNSIDYATTESSQVRYLVWHESVELIKKNWLYGVGTGDIKDILLERYKEKKMWWTYEKKMNSHNQFLQSWGALGIPGIFLLLGGFVVAFYHSIKRRKFIYSGLLLLLILNFMVESMLETQAGVIFFAFFNSLFCFTPSAKTDIGNPLQGQKSPLLFLERPSEAG